MPNENAKITMADVDISDEGRESVVIDFALSEGGEARFRGSLNTDASIAFVQRVLRHLGWTGTNILTIDTLVGRGAVIALEDREHNGRTFTEVRFPLMGAGGAGLAARGHVDAKKALAARLQGHFAADAAPYVRPSARAAAPSPRPTQHRTTAVNGQLPVAPILGPGDAYEPTMGEDDIPFLSTGSPRWLGITRRCAQR